MSVLYDTNVEQFHSTLPCVSCRFIEICKIREQEIKPVDLPNNFNVKITCNYKDKLDNNIHIK